MASKSPIREPLDAPPPPLPTRNPLRDDLLFKDRLRLSQPKLDGNFATPTSPISPTSQDIFNELDHELKDTQQRLVSAIYEGNKIHSLCKSSGENMPEARQKRLSGRIEDKECSLMEFLMSEAELEESSGDEVSDECGLWSESSGSYSRLVREEYGEKVVREGEDSGHIASLPPPSLTYSAEEGEYVRSRTWLARELPSSELRAAECMERLSRDLSPSKRHTLSPFPPASPISGNREYVPFATPLPRPICPVSPLNNGRDAYGNYIPSNTTDLFVAKSESDSPTLDPLDQRTSGLGSPPQVHLRGGWELPRPFWRRSGYAEPSHTHEPTDNIERTDRSHPTQNSRLVNETVDRQRLMNHAIPSVRYEDTVEPKKNPANRNRTSRKLATTNGRKNDANLRGDHDINAHSPQEPKLADLPDTNPYDNLSSIFHKHFGIQRVPPVLDIDNSRQKAHIHLDIPTWAAPRSVPIDAASALVNTSGALQPLEYPIYRPKPLPNTEKQSGFLESGASTTSSQSQKTGPRHEKRWDKELPPPPEEPTPMYPEEVDFYLADEIGSQDNESIFSARTADDRLKGLVDLQTSGPYRKARQLREARRIYEEQERRRRQMERERDIDVHTITPSMSISHRQARRQPPPPRDTPMQGMGRIPENESYHSPQRSVPRPTTHEQSMQPFPQSGNPTAAIPAPILAPATTEPPRNDNRPHMNSMQMAFHIAGKVTRFLLAAPSDPNSKTYSKRYPPTEAQRLANAPVRTSTSSVLERISDTVPPQATFSPTNTSTSTNKPNKGKGKDKGKIPAFSLALNPPPSPRLAFTTPRPHLPSTFSGSTAVHTNPRYTGSTLLSAGGPSTPPAPRPSNFHDTPVYARGLHVPETRYEESYAGTMWPEQDERGNVVVGAAGGGSGGGGRGLRGGSGGDEAERGEGTGDGDGVGVGDVRSSFSAGSSLLELRSEKTEKKRDKGERKRSAWGKREYALALHSMG
ncbi:Nn.00g064100.m01.CDS01 [Neocucurbitaria sp. VM-36]